MYTQQKGKTPNDISGFQFRTDVSDDKWQDANTDKKNDFKKSHRNDVIKR